MAKYETDADRDARIQHERSEMNFGQALELLKAAMGE